MSCCSNLRRTLHQTHLKKNLNIRNKQRHAHCWSAWSSCSVTYWENALLGRSYFLLLSRKMYDCVVLESTNLPSGVTLVAVLDGCDEKEVAAVLSNMIDFNNIQQEDIDIAGKLTSPIPVGWSIYLNESLRQVLPPTNVAELAWLGVFFENVETAVNYSTCAAEARYDREPYLRSMQPQIFGLWCRPSLGQTLWKFLVQCDAWNRPNRKAPQ